LRERFVKGGLDDDVGGGDQVEDVRPPAREAHDSRHALRTHRGLQGRPLRTVPHDEPRRRPLLAREGFQRLQEIAVPFLGVEPGDRHQPGAGAGRPLRARPVEGGGITRAKMTEIESVGDDFDLVRIHSLREEHALDGLRGRDDGGGARLHSDSTAR
jgi:hypothetical protein